MSSKFLRVAAAVAILTLSFGAVSQVAAADYLKTVTHMDAFAIQGQQQPARTDTSQMWLVPDKAAMVTGEGQTFILRNDLGVMYFVDSNNKTYVKVPVDFMSKLQDEIAAEKGDSAAAAAKSAMQNVFDNIDITVTAMDSTKKVGEWTAKLYEVKIAMPMGTVTTESWNSTDVDIDLSMYQSVSNAVMAAMPGFEKMLAKMSQLKGATVESVSTMNMGGAEVKTTTKLLDYAKKDAPAGIFDIPDGYTEDTSGMGGMMGGH